MYYWVSVMWSRIFWNGSALFSSKFQRKENNTNSPVFNEASWLQSAHRVRGFVKYRKIVVETLYSCGKPYKNKTLWVMLVKFPVIFKNVFHFQMIGLHLTSWIYWLKTLEVFKIIFSLTFMFPIFVFSFGL